MNKTQIHGFTLLELLIAMSIVATLAAIAIPQYSAYKKRAFDTRAMSDLRNVALAEEAYFIDEESYLSCADSNCLSLPGVAALSQGVTVTITASTTAFTGQASNTKGTGKVFSWDSELGGLQP